MSRVTEAEVTAADEDGDNDDDVQKELEGFVIVAVLEEAGEEAWLEWESEGNVMLELVLVGMVVEIVVSGLAETGDVNVIPADVVVNAWHSSTELTSARDKFFNNSSFSTTNPNERSFIVTNVSSITNDEDEEDNWIELCLIQITDGAGRPNVRLIHD